MSDDDIIELTEIVKKGHPPPVQDTPPAGGAAAVESAAALPDDFPAAEPGVATDSAGWGASAAQPDFGADLDELLQNYDNPAAAPTQSAPTAKGEAVPVPISGQSSAERPVDPDEKLELPPLSDLDALLEELGVQTNAPPAASAAQNHLPGDDLDALPFPGLVTSETAPAAPKSAKPADDDGIDLHELDALLDSVLLSAPRQSPVSAEPPRPVPAPAPVVEPEPVLSAAPAAGPAPVVEPEPVLSAAPAAGPAPVVEPEPVLSAAPAAEPAPVVEPEPVLSAAPEADMPVSAAAAPVQACAPAVNECAALDALRAEMDALKAELEDLRANMEKYAAAAAAKVIREELAVIAANLE